MGVAGGGSEGAKNEGKGVGWGGVGFGRGAGVGNGGGAMGPGMIRRGRVMDAGSGLGNDDDSEGGDESGSSGKRDRVFNGLRETFSSAGTSS
jgi:hypothetical protein